jgi:hypothetical protein
LHETYRNKVNKHTVITKKLKDVLSSETKCIASPILDNDSFSEQVAAVCSSSVSTTEVANSLVEMVSKLNSNMEELKNDDATFLRSRYRRPHIWDW